VRQFKIRRIASKTDGFELFEVNVQQSLKNEIILGTGAWLAAMKKFRYAS